MPLTAEHYALARYLARRYRCPTHDGDDLEQEALVVILKALPLYRPEMGPEMALLTMCIRSHLSRLVRSDLSRRSREEPFGDEFLDGRHSNEPDPAEAAQDHEALERAREFPALRRLLAGESADGAEYKRRQRAIAKLSEEFS